MENRYADADAAGRRRQGIDAFSIREQQNVSNPIQEVMKK
jgi:hypothetical protein